MEEAFEYLCMKLKKNLDINSGILNSKIYLKMGREGDVLLCLAKGMLKILINSSILNSKICLKKCFLNDKRYLV
jgi:hypothetical protein